MHFRFEISKIEHIGKGKGKGKGGEKKLPAAEPLDWLLREILPLLQTVRRRADGATIRECVSTGFRTTSVLELYRAKDGAKASKNHKTQNWCKGKVVKLEKR